MNQDAPHQSLDKPSDLPLPPRRRWRKHGINIIIRYRLTRCPRPRPQPAIASSPDQVPGASLSVQSSGDKKKRREETHTIPPTTPAKTGTPNPTPTPTTTRFPTPPVFPSNHVFCPPPSIPPVGAGAPVAVGRIGTPVAVAVAVAVGTTLLPVEETLSLSLATTTPPSTATTNPLTPSPNATPLAPPVTAAGGNALAGNVGTTTPGATTVTCVAMEAYTEEDWRDAGQPSRLMSAVLGERQETPV